MEAHAGKPATETPRAGCSSWQSELRSWLSNPLLVAVVAALLGSLLIPSITRKWQNHQKALEIQTGLVSEMSQSVSSAVASSRFIAAGLVARSSQAPGAEQQAWNDLYREWTTSGASIGAKLRAYFGATVASEWQSFNYALTDFVALSARAGPGSARQAQVAEIYAYRKRLPGVRLSTAQWRQLAQSRGDAGFQNAYAELARGFLARQDELVQRVLSSHVSGF
ncbi:MAG: hypothetical protein ACXVHQ_27675 [Solirubrobacteraceae bacterium]